ncbi:BTB domain-containing protein [Favolaschia claudopus]|uniref:BTB domain-containing protein n=1 Tax=Favolaschia claudopus TaxID=2862362 RepID=A0AAV9ZD31_9AGAR
MSTDPSSGADAVPFPGPPFDSADADVIFRSSDVIEFRLHKALLSLVSPVFRDMFTLPQPASESSTTLPVVEVTETSVLFDKALRFFYPGARPKVDNPSELRDVLTVLIHKYDMQGVIPIAQQHLERYLTSHPLAAYVVAHTFQWNHLASEAAKASLKTPIRSANAAAPRNLQHFSAFAYHNLLFYHHSCAEAAKAEVTSLRWIPSPNEYVWFGCSNCARAPTSYCLADTYSWRPCAWFDTYLNNIGSALMQTPGVDLAAHASIRNAYKAASKCTTCRDKIFEQLHLWIRDSLQPRIDAAIDKVELIF